MSEEQSSDRDWFEDPRQQAAYSIQYYDRLIAGKDDEAIEWILGLYMAKAWAELIAHPKLDFKDALLFYAALESQRQKQGSHWVQMILWVGHWLAVRMNIDDRAVDDFSYRLVRNPRQFDLVVELREWKQNHSSSSPKTKT